jgi:hypothetical protein
MMGAFPRECEQVHVPTSDGVWRPRSCAGRALGRGVCGAALGIVPACPVAHRSGCAGPRTRIPGNQHTARGIRALVPCVAFPTRVAVGKNHRVGLGDGRSPQRDCSSQLESPTGRLHTGRGHGANPFDSCAQSGPTPAAVRTDERRNVLGFQGSKVLGS